MIGYLIGLVVALACSAVAATKPDALKVDYQRIKIIITTPEPSVDPVTMEPDYANRLLRQIQYELDLTKRLISNQTKRANQLNYELEGLKSNKVRIVKEITQMQNDLLRQKQKLAQTRVRVDHSWLLLERCSNFEEASERVRRIASQVAAKRAVADMKLQAEKHFIPKYLKLQKSLENQFYRDGVLSILDIKEVPGNERVVK